MTIALDVADPGDIELRCPVGHDRGDGTCSPGKLFALLRITGEQPSFIKPDNLIEMACPECKRRLVQRGTAAKRVLHRYNFAGELVDTLVEQDPLSDR